MVIVITVQDKQNISEIVEKLSFDDLKLIINHVIAPLGYKVQIKDLNHTILWEDEVSAEKGENNLGKKCHEVNFARSSPCLFCTAIESLKTAEYFEKVDQNAQDGRWYEVIALPLHFKDDLVAIEFIRDITAENENRKSIQSKTDLTTGVLFSNILRHDVPSYLNNANLALKTLKISSTTDETQKEFLAIAQSNTERAIKILTEIKELSLLESPGNTLHPVNLLDTLAEIELDLNRLFPEKKLRIEIHSEIGHNNAMILANNLLSDLFLNIMTNAIKYDPMELVHIQIIVKRNVEEENAIEIHFVDQGKGIPPNIKEVIFDRNKRIEQGWAPTINSTGIGITIIKTLTEIFKGKIHYENRIPDDWAQGTKVVLSFPQIKEICGST